MEGKKFLDLDHLCDQVLDDSDRDMFSEAIRCYQVGSHRASVILAWSVTANRLFKRICDLADEHDGVAQSAIVALRKVDKQARFEEVLIAQAKGCDLIDDYEEKCLRFARDTRSKCAHPTDVVPSAEAVRHILYICSQHVLCRNGFRGISYVNEFVAVKLKDKHLFSNKQRTEVDCRYFIDKVSDRVKVQFGSEIAQNFDTVNRVWLGNALIFLRYLFLNLERSLLVKIAKKLQDIEIKNRYYYSIIVGFANQDGIWDNQEINRSKAHVRESLSSGKVEFDAFQAFGNLCALGSFDDDDLGLVKKRFPVLIEHIARHRMFQERCGTALLRLVIDAFSEGESVKSPVMRGLWQFSRLDLVFSAESSEARLEFIDALIQSDWRDPSIASVWQQVGSWPSQLQSAYLRRSSDYLSECTEDNPDDILTPFSAATVLANEAPGLIPEEFEKSILDILESRAAPVWFTGQGDAYRNFIGQVGLLQEGHTALFSRVCEISLPELDDPDDDSSDEY